MDTAEQTLTLGTQPEERRRGGPKGRLLLVDDDAVFRESLGRNLMDEGYDVTSVDGGEAALGQLSNSDEEEVDAVLLDWRMPGLNGLGVLRLMRQRGHRMPVLFLTALTDSVYEEAALAFGAVDFISKSRSLSVILKRLSLITERRKRATAATGTEVIRRGKLELRPLQGRVFLDGKRVALTLTEFKILQTLAEASEQGLSHREIYDLVRGEDFVAGWGQEGYRVNVRTFIKRIRQKLRAIDGTFDCIKNQQGYGYFWDGG